MTFDMAAKKPALVALTLLVFIGTNLTFPHVLNSANLTSAKDTLQSSRLSVNARVDATGTTVGSSIVTIKSSASAPANSISTVNLRAGDTVTIGTGSYTIVGIVDATRFTVTPVLASGDADDNDPVYLKMKPQHVITFNTASAVSGGFFQVLIPADATTPNNGNPDDDGFDFGGGSIDVTPTDTTGYTFIGATNAATASGATGCTAPANYHCFEFHYTGAGGVGTAITLTIGNTSGTNTLIAPAPTSAHSTGYADSYPIFIKNFTNTSNPNSVSAIDQVQGRIALIEAVRVTASVDPTITFRLQGVAASASTCGITTDVATDTGTNAPFIVPFGSMSLNTFKNAAHTLTVSTNASSGYAVTAVENDQLGKGGATTPFIPDTLGDGGNASHTAFDDWDNASTNGFGYTIDNNDAASVPFEFSTVTGNCTGSTYCAKQFAAVADVESPQTIFSSSTIANNEDVNVCYKLSVGATQANGDYENQVTYTATATF